MEISIQKKTHPLRSLSTLTVIGPGLVNYAAAAIFDNIAIAASLYC